jgi:hypothetical protein
VATEQPAVTSSKVSGKMRSILKNISIDSLGTGLTNALTDVTNAT